MKNIFSELKAAFEFWPQVMKRAWFWLIVSSFFQLLITASQKYFMEKDLNALAISWGLFVIGSTMIVSTVGMLIVNQIVNDVENKKHTPLTDAVSINFKFAMIESLRALWPITKKSLLFIIPGLIEVMRLYWIPFIVQFVPEYREGKIDALEASRAFVKGRFWRAFGLLLFTFVLGILPHLGLGEGDLLDRPMRLAIYIFASIALELYGDILIYRFYMRNRGEL
jgi:hypothetical protein